MYQPEGQPTKAKTPDREKMKRKEKLLWQENFIEKIIPYKEKGPPRE